MDARHRVASAKSSIVHVGQLAGHTTIKRRAIPAAAVLTRGVPPPAGESNPTSSSATAVGEKRPRVEDDKDDNAAVQKAKGTTASLGEIDGDDSGSDDDENELRELQAAQRQQQQHQAAAAASQSAHQQSAAATSSSDATKKKPAATSGVALASYTSDTLFSASSRKQPNTAKGKSVNQTDFMKKFFK